MRYVWEFIAILLITLSLLIFYSFSPATIKIGTLELKKTNFKEFIQGDTAKVKALVADDVTFVKPPLDTSKQVILFIGDSMVEKMRYRMRDYCEYNGHELRTVIWYSSSTKWYGQSDTIKYFINKYHPTYVILVLGANELFIRDIKTKRAKYVQNIIAQIDTIPFIWVGPPNWKKDTGINQLIFNSVGALQFYPTYKIALNNPEFGRAKDGRHPNPQAAAMWVDKLAFWIMHQSKYPIKLEKPDKPGTGSTHTVVLQPLRE